MALSSKSPNAIFMEIRKLSAALPRRYCTMLSQLPYVRPPSLPLFDCGVEKKNRVSLFSLARDAEFDSHLIVPRLIGDRGFHYLSATEPRSIRIYRDNSSLRPTLSGERKLSSSKEYVRSNYSQNIQETPLPTTKIKSRRRPGRQPSMKVETWLVREADGWPLSIPHVGHVGKCARNANRSISRVVFALFFLFNVTFRQRSFLFRFLL